MSPEDPTQGGLSLDDADELVDREDVEYVEPDRSFADEKFEGLRERYGEIKGVFQLGVVEDGAVLLWRYDDWAPMGSEVQQADGWVETAEWWFEDVTGVPIGVTAIERLERSTFRREGAEDDSFLADSVFLRASLAEEAQAFREDPTLAAHVREEHDPEDLPEMGWFEAVPEGVHENHVDHVELFLE
jgi:hypothetical protein